MKKFQRASGYTSANVAVAVAGYVSLARLDDVLLSLSMAAALLVATGWLED